MKTLLFSLIAVGLALASTVHAQDEQEMRYWTDASGIYQIEAVLQGVEGDNVILFRNGETRSIPLKNFSQQDQDYVNNWKNFQEAARQAGMPTPSASSAPAFEQPVSPEPDPKPNLFSQAIEAISEPETVDAPEPTGAIIPAEPASEPTEQDTRNVLTEEVSDLQGEMETLATDLELGEAPPWLLALGGLSLILIVVGTIMFIVGAFCESVLWGFGVMLVPFVGLVFLCMHWSRGKNGFLTSLAGHLILIGTSVYYAWLNPGTMPV